MEHQTEITKKEINFISDIDLRVVLYERLKELDRIFLVNANYSTIFLAISTVEGILKHIAAIFKTYIQKSQNYPNYPNSNRRKKFTDLTIDELYDLLKEIDILPIIENFEHIYGLFRRYRNFIHPQKQTKERWPTDLGYAQMAIGLLNATVSYLDRHIFINKEIFEKIAGNPDYDSKVLYLKLDKENPYNKTHSFLVWNRKISDTLSLNFDLELSKDSVFNFVFNFVNDGSFKMLRLDNRERDKNCVLHCTQKYFWKERLIADPESPPDKPVLPVEIKIDFKRGEFRFAVDKNPYSFKDWGKDTGNIRDLFTELKKDLKIGFFNEVGPVSLSNIRIE